MPRAIRSPEQKDGFPDYPTNAEKRFPLKHRSREIFSAFQTEYDLKLESRRAQHSRSLNLCAAHSPCRQKWLRVRIRSTAKLWDQTAETPTDHPEGAGETQHSARTLCPQAGPPLYPHRNQTNPKRPSACRKPSARAKPAPIISSYQKYSRGARGGNPLAYRDARKRGAKQEGRGNPRPAASLSEQPHHPVSAGVWPRPSRL